MSGRLLVLPPQPLSQLLGKYRVLHRIVSWDDSAITTLVYLITAYRPSEARSQRPPLSPRARILRPMLLFSLPPLHLLTLVVLPSPVGPLDVLTPTDPAPVGRGASLLLALIPWGLVLPFVFTWGARILGVILLGPQCERPQPFQLARLLRWHQMRALWPPWPPVVE